MNEKDLPNDWRRFINDIEAPFGEIIIDYIEDAETLVEVKNRLVSYFDDRVRSTEFYRDEAKRLLAIEYDCTLCLDGGSPKSNCEGYVKRIVGECTGKIRSKETS